MSDARVRRLWLSVVLSGLALMFMAGCAQNASDTPSRPDPKLGVKQVDDAESQPDSDGNVEEGRADGSSSGKDIAIVGSAFQPAILTIKAGTTVVWTNEDGANHEVHADDNAYKSGIIGKDGTVEVAYDAPGTFTYHCHVHPNMRGTIIVE